MLLAGLVLVAVGCRSTASFCSTLKTEKQRLTTVFETRKPAAGSDDLSAALGNLGASRSGLQQLQTSVKRLSRLAPDQIRADVESVRRQLDDLLQGNKSRPDDLMGLIGGIVGKTVGLALPLARIDNYARQNCGQGL